MQKSTQIGIILQAISVLDLEEQLFVTEVLNKRAINLRRNQNLIRAKEAEENYQKGHTHTVTVEDLMMMSSSED
jgi:hypothetical protein